MVVIKCIPLLVFAVGLVAYVNAKSCTRSCSRMWSRICTKDGQTYGNRCTFEYAKCKKDGKLEEIAGGCVNEGKPWCTCAETECAKSHKMVSAGVSLKDDGCVCPRSKCIKKTACDLKREKATYHNVYSRTLPVPVPTCATNGLFNERQCSGRYCWCVHKRTGKEISRPKEADPITMGKTKWGKWSKKISCNPGTFVIGFSLRVESLHGIWGDDTAMNGIELMCSNYVRTDRISGYWGDWKPQEVCGKGGGYVEAINFRSERDRGSGDDTAGNDVQMKCSGGKVLKGHGTTAGSWDGFKWCPAGTYLCGVRARIQGKQGNWKDDTALNQIQATCCGKLKC